MDPDYLLAEIREMVKLVLETGEPPTPDAHYSLADKVDDLDAWLTRGGFKPLAWSRAY